MNKQFQGSKKAARKAAFLERQEKKNQSKKKERRLIEAMNSGNIEDMAHAMGIRLK